MAAAAVVAAVVVAGVWGYVRVENQQLAKTYEGSYVIVDGKRTDNLVSIKDEVSQLLADADRIEAHARSQEVIGDAEREVLQSVSPKQRKQIERLLNE